MREQAVRGIINVIPLLIIIVSILLPLSANGWDIGRTAIPANPFLPGSGLLTMEGTGAAAVEGPVLSVRNAGVTADGARVFLEVQLKNPLPMQIEVKEFSASAPMGGTRVNLALAQPVSIPSGGSGVCRLEGPAPRGISSRAQPPRASDLSGLRMTISSGGMEMTLDEDAIRGMLS